MFPDEIDGRKAKSGGPASITLGEDPNMIGENILDVAKQHLGEGYELGARAILSNPNHRGPWDCAEYASWCAYQAYRIVFGTYGQNPRTADAYSGKWYDDGKDADMLISVGQALGTPGAFIVRRPGAFSTTIGHVAICLGDGRIYEARGRLYGVVESDDATDRNWSSGVLLPGVMYTGVSATTYTQPSDILRLVNPYTRGDHVLVLQCALARAGFDPGTLDGIYGGDTATAVSNYQITEGLSADGEVGRETAILLEVGWPIEKSLKSSLCKGLEVA